MCTDADKVHSKQPFGNHTIGKNQSFRSPSIKFAPEKNYFYRLVRNKNRTVFTFESNFLCARIAHCIQFFFPPMPFGLSCELCAVQREKKKHKNASIDNNKKQPNAIRDCVRLCVASASWPLQMWSILYELHARAISME